MKAEKSRLQKDNARLHELLSDLQATSDKELERLRREMGLLVDEIEAERRKAGTSQASTNKEKEDLEQVSAVCSVFWVYCLC